MPIGSGVTFQAQAAGNCSGDISGFDGHSGTNMNIVNYPGIAVTISGTSDPLVPIYQNQVFLRSIHIPSGTVVTGGTDGHLVIVTPDGNYEDESFLTTAYNGGWNAALWIRKDLYGSGFGGGISADGSSIMGGLVRAGDLTNGIHHALQLDLYTQLQKSGWVWPAISQDGWMTNNPPPGHVPEGTLAAIPASVDVNSLGLGTPQGLVMAHALQDYGAYDVDSTSAGAAFIAEPAVANEVNYSGTSPFYNDLQKLRAQLRCVTDNSSTTVGGGGTPRVPLAPPFVAAYTMP